MADERQEAVVALEKAIKNAAEKAETSAWNTAGHWATVARDLSVAHENLRGY